MAKVDPSSLRGTRIASLPHRLVRTGAHLSPVPSTISRGSLAPTARACPSLLRGHTAARSAGSPGGGGAFSPDGSRIVTISGRTRPLRVER